MSGHACESFRRVIMVILIRLLAYGEKDLQRRTGRHAEPAASC
ncbi:hypothetical protein T261_7786 [Streptomyces lydicus]|nr:hypothetical protein T261_7786 [Streptomyces lydicus]